MLDIHSDLHKGFQDLKVANVALENRLTEGNWDNNSQRKQINTMEKQLIDFRVEMNRVNSKLLSNTGESYEIKKKCVPFDVTQVRVLKEIADRRFESLN